MTHETDARRDFLKVSAAAAGLALAGATAASAAETAVKLGASPLTQPPLPFDPTALEPTVSAQTLSFHYGKHHKAYFDNLNKAVAGTPLASATLEQIIVQTAGVSEKTGLFNNAAQAWNHDFFWHCMSPTGGGDPGRPRGGRL